MRLKLAASLGVAFAFATPAVSQAWTFETPHGQPSAERLTEEAAKREREVAEAKEREEHERITKETQTRQATEQAEREQAQHAAETRPGEEAERKEEAAERQAMEASDAQCLVPSLKGDSLNTARNALGRVHCKLGKVSKPRGHRGTLVVTWQSLGHGKKLAGGTAIAVKLGPVKVMHS